jgi:hypothetical protein
LLPGFRRLQSAARTNAATSITTLKYSKNPTIRLSIILPHALQSKLGSQQKTPGCDVSAQPGAAFGVRHLLS